RGPEHSVPIGGDVPRERRDVYSEYQWHKHRSEQHPAQPAKSESELIQLYSERHTERSWSEPERIRRIRPGGAHAFQRQKRRPAEVRTEGSRREPDARRRHHHADSAHRRNAAAPELYRPGLFPFGQLPGRKV